MDRKVDQVAETGFFEQIFKQVIPKTPAYMGKFMLTLLNQLNCFFLGLNLSLKGQRIIPKITQKREIKCERTENKSLQSIYTLARLASSSSRVRRSVGSSTGPTIMDFMQCINFKSRLDREREMIRRKIRSSTLYRKPSFSRSSGFSIYNANGDISKVSCISKNIKINEFKDEPLRKIKSPLLCGDEQEDESSKEEKILCIGNKYLDITSNLISTSIAKSVSNSALSLINNDLSAEKLNEADFEKAISQSHLSPSMCLSPSNLFLRKQTPKEQSQENLIKPKTAKLLMNNFTSSKSDDSKTPSDSNDGEEIQDIQSLTLSDNLKRKDHNKIIKKSTHFLYAVGINVGKYSDAQKTEVALDDLPNSIITNQNKTQNTPASSTTGSVKAKKSGTSSRKKSSHSKKSNSPKSTATRKSENS